MSNPLTNNTWIYKISERFGPYVDNEEETRGQIISNALKTSDYIPEGGKFILDFEEVKFISPSLMFQCIDKFAEESKKRKRALFGGRYLIAKDPNEDMRILLNIILRAYQSSLLVVHSDSRDDEILRLPRFLKETLDIIKENGPLTADALSTYHGPENRLSIRERLRQLYLRGLVEREPIIGSKERITFSYTAFSISLDTIY